MEEAMGSGSQELKQKYECVMTALKRGLKAEVETTCDRLLTDIKAVCLQTMKNDNRSLAFVDSSTGGKLKRMAFYEATLRECGQFVSQVG